MRKTISGLWRGWDIMGASDPVRWRLLEDCGDESLAWDRNGHEETVGWWSDDGDLMVDREVLRALVKQANRATDTDAA